MREIKFRAWDKRELKMIPWMSAFFGEYVFPNVMDETDFVPYEIMQFTGLKDKNGVLIYEGDIVKDTWSGTSPEIIKWGEAEWLAGKLALNSYLFSKEGTAEFIEVIGNIYENPELLN